MRKQKVVDSICPNCGSKLDYNAKLKKWKCKYCDGEFTLEELKEKNNAASSENNEEKVVEEVVEETEVVEEDKKKNNKKEEEEQQDYVNYTCQNCGAQIIADEQTSATFCVYCGNTAILKNKLSDKFHPDWIIPFKKEEKEAKEAFKNLSNGRPLCPKEFTDIKNIEKIKGVYIPFWLFDYEASGSLNCKGTKVRVWTTGDTQYTETKEYALNRTGSMKFTRIPRDGSTRFADDIMDSIEPFNYDELEEYNHAYLSGFFAERYDVEADIATEDAKKRAVNSATDEMFNDSNGICPTKHIIENTIQGKETKREYVLLPVYMVNVKYNGKMHTFAMNGQTGEFIGDIPIDKKKLWLYRLGIFFGILIGIILISLIFCLITGGAI